MPNFSYTVRTDEGKNEKGVLSAPDYGEALARARKKGVVIELNQAKAEGGLGALGFLGKKKISLKDRIIFTQQLSVMLNAGVTLVVALKGLQEETTNKQLAKILIEIVGDVEEGLPFSDALEKHPKNFSNIYCQMVRSAEKSGNLAGVLMQLTQQQQKEYELRGKVRGALMYPAIVSVLMIGVIVMVITFILPKLSTLFTESGTALPGSTRFLLALSAFFVTKYYVIIIGVVGAYFGFRRVIATEKGNFAWDMFKMRVPVLGGFLKKSYMARFSQSFSALAGAGIPVLEVFKTVKGVVGNVVYEKEIDRISADVSNGIKVSTAIRKSKYFPPMVGQLVAVGEQSGDLAGMFKVIAEFFEKEVDAMAKNLSTLLEPIIMIVMGGAIGFILISVLQPIYGLINTV